MKKTFTILTIFSYLVSFTIIYSIIATDTYIELPSMFSVITFAIITNLVGAYCWWFRNNRAHLYDCNEPLHNHHDGCPVCDIKKLDDYKHNIFD